jgi:hypothetical protein
MDEPSKKGCCEHPWFQWIPLIHIGTGFVGIQHYWEEKIIAVSQRYPLPIVWTLIQSSPQLLLAQTVKNGQLWMD